MTWFKRTPRILFAECTLFFQSLCEIKCETEKPNDMEEDKDFVRIFKPDERKFTIPDFNQWENNHFSNAFPLWIFFVFAIAVFFAFVCCCIFFVLARKRSIHRHASNAALIHPPPSTIRPGRSWNSVQNFASVNRIADYERDRNNHLAVPNLNVAVDRNRDVPPEYAAVVLPSPPVCDATANRPRYPRVVKSKKVETPPPEYITVAPFQ